MHEKRYTGQRVSVIRAENQGTITGYGAVFYKPGDAGTQFELWPGVVERIDPGAFTRAIAEDDVRSAYNHDMTMLLGRTSAGTLRLSVDAVGLRYEVTPPATRADVLEMVQRGDVTGSSFMFEARAVRWDREGDIEVRTLLDVALYEVGPVPFPAYTATTSSTRAASEAALRAELDEWRASRDTRRRRIAVGAGIALTRLAAGCK